MKHSTITFVQAGGTIDKDYMPSSGTHGYNFEIGEPASASILSRIQPHFNYELNSLVRKDSLDINDADRELIKSFVEQLDNDRIIITHGTDTIRQTAESLSGISNKTIVLTGSMTPEKFKQSDADFNLGMAVGAVQALPHGVYICLYGLITPWHEYTNSNTDT